MKNNLRLAALLLALVMLLPLFACSDKAGEDNDNDPGVEAGTTLPDVPGEGGTESPDGLPETPEIEEPAFPFTDPLTGLGSDIDYAPKRPIVVSVNNIKESLPQSGIQSAGIIYEVLAEGGITRLIAVFGDAETMPTIGTVRSTRPYIVDIATAYNPIFIHFGGSEDGKARVKENKIMNLDGIAYDGTYFYRDKERIKKAGLEHSAFTNSELICKAAEKLKALDLVRDPEKCTPAFSFSDEPVTPSQIKADSVKISFSNYNSKSSFTYDKESETYLKSQYGEDHIDVITGKPLSVKNVFVLEIPSKTYDSYGRREMNTTGSGQGFYITNGGAVSIKWARKDVHSQFTYTLTDSTELKVNPGNSYISVVNKLTDAMIVAIGQDDTAETKSN